jgi:hypothetical protein
MNNRLAPMLESSIPPGTLAAMLPASCFLSDGRIDRTDKHLWNIEVEELLAVFQRHRSELTNVVPRRFLRTLSNDGS